jgi:hypothetical protein
LIPRWQQYIEINGRPVSLIVLIAVSVVGVTGNLFSSFFSSAKASYTLGTGTFLQILNAPP